MRKKEAFEDDSFSEEDGESEIDSLELDEEFGEI